MYIEGVLGRLVGRQVITIIYTQLDQLKRACTGINDTSVLDQIHVDRISECLGKSEAKTRA